MNESSLIHTETYLSVNNQSLIHNDQSPKHTQYHAAPWRLQGKRHPDSLELTVGVPPNDPITYRQLPKVTCSVCVCLIKCLKASSFIQVPVNSISL